MPLASSLGRVNPCLYFVGVCLSNVGQRTGGELRPGPGRVTYFCELIAERSKKPLPQPAELLALLRWFRSDRDHPATGAMYGTRRKKTTFRRPTSARDRPQHRVGVERRREVRDCGTHVNWI